MTPLDLERERVVARLRTDCAEGRISLDRFSDLVGDVYAARTVDELGELALPRPAEPAPMSKADAPRGRRWVVAVFGQSAKKGRFRLEDETCAAAVFGDCIVDLSEATITTGEPAVTAVSLFGTVTVVVPEGVDVVVEGASIFGNRRSDVHGRDLPPDAPVLVVRAWACFGDVRIRSPKRGRR